MDDRCIGNWVKLSRWGQGWRGKGFNNSALCHCSETAEMSTAIADRQDNGYVSVFLFTAIVMLDRYNTD